MLYHITLCRVPLPPNLRILGVDLCALWCGFTVVAVHGARSITGAAEYLAAVGTRAVDRTSRTFNFWHKLFRLLASSKP